MQALEIRMAAPQWIRQQRTLPLTIQLIWRQQQLRWATQLPWQQQRLQ